MTGDSGSFYFIQQSRLHMDQNVFSNIKNNMF